MMKWFVVLLIAFITIGGISDKVHADTIWAPMIDNFDGNVDADEWFGIADASGNVSATIFSGDDPFSASLFGSSGSNTLNINAGSEGTVSLFGLTPGETVRLDILGGFHYRPMFTGVDSLYINNNSTSPNDWFSDTSDIELGFDTRWSSLPSKFADITWYYDVQGQSNFDWKIKSGWPGGAGIANVELFDPFDVLQGTLGSLGSSFGPVGFNILNPTDGLWSVKLTSPNVITPYAQHYLINASPNNLVLLSDSVLPPSAVPEPATIALLGIGLAGLAGVGARRKWKKKAVDKG